jgi:hypothetical protein
LYRKLPCGGKRRPRLEAEAGLLDGLSRSLGELGVDLA